MSTKQHPNAERIEIGLLELISGSGSIRFDDRDHLNVIFDIEPLAFADTSIQEFQNIVYSGTMIFPSIANMKRGCIRVAFSVFKENTNWDADFIDRLKTLFESEAFSVSAKSLGISQISFGSKVWRYS